MCAVVNLGYASMGKVSYMYKKKMKLSNVFRH